MSISIGSSSRDHSVVTEILGQKIRLERVGTDGDFDRAAALFREHDGKVDAFGLGGFDLYLVAGKKRYMIRDAKKVADNAKKTPIFDGSGLKNTLEREIIKYLVQDGAYLSEKSKVFIINSVDRFGMAEAIHEQGCDVVFSDFMTGLNVPIPIRSMSVMRSLAAILLPIFTRVPFEMLYPTGKKQDERTPKFGKWFKWADAVAGDFLVILRYMPDDMRGKVIIANTVTQENLAELKRLGVRALITTTPEYEGRSFGTNVMEAAYAAIHGKKHGENFTHSELMDLIKKIGVEPRIAVLNP